MMGPHKNLKVWKLSMDFITEVYRLTANFPSNEIYGITSQMRRAAISITSNIAEGYGRSSNQEVIHFLYVSLGSSNELDSQIQIANNLGYISNMEYEMLDAMNDEINKMLRSLIFHRKQQTI
jgi:four helix bundle protein